MKLNISYIGVLFCAVRTNWGSSAKRGVVFMKLGLYNKDKKRKEELL